MRACAGGVTCGRIDVIEAEMSGDHGGPLPCTATILASAAVAEVGARLWTTGTRHAPAPEKDPVRMAKLTERRARPRPPGIRIAILSEDRLLCAGLLRIVAS